MQTEDILFGGGMLVVTVDTLVGQDALAMVVVDAVVFVEDETNSIG